MNSNWNLPPGCKDTDIPGNRPEDIAFEKFIEYRLYDLWMEWDGDKLYENESEELTNNPSFESYVTSQFEADVYGEY